MSLGTPEVFLAGGEGPDLEPRGTHPHFGLVDVDDDDAKKNIFFWPASLPSAAFWAYSGPIFGLYSVNFCPFQVHFGSFRLILG